MLNYKRIVENLHFCATNGTYCALCEKSEHGCSAKQLKLDAANAITELIKAGAAMHTWIFLNTCDEEAAYDECHLSDEMNALFGYAGKLILHTENEP